MKGKEWPEFQGTRKGRIPPGWALRRLCYGVDLFILLSIFADFSQYLVFFFIAVRVHTGG